MDGHLPNPGVGRRSNFINRNSAINDPGAVGDNFVHNGGLVKNPGDVRARQDISR